MEALARQLAGRRTLRSLHTMQHDRLCTLLASKFVRSECLISSAMPWSVESSRSIVCVILLVFPRITTFSADQPCLTEMVAAMSPAKLQRSGSQRK